MNWQVLRNIEQLYSIKGSFLLMYRAVKRFTFPKVTRRYVTEGIYQEQIWFALNSPVKKGDIILTRIDEEGEFVIAHMYDFDFSSFSSYCAVNLIKNQEAKRKRRQLFKEDVPIGYQTISQEEFDKGGWTVVNE